MPRKTKTVEEIKATAKENTIKGLSLALQYLGHENGIEFQEEEVLEYVYETIVVSYNDIHGFKDLLSPTLEQLDGISKLCEVWKPYVCEESFSKLLLHCFKRICAIHSCTLYARNINFNNSKKVTSCIGNIVPLRSNPPITLSTSLNKLGEVTVSH